MTAARAQMGAANFDRGVIMPVLARMVERVARINGDVRLHGLWIPPVNGRGQLRHAVYMAVCDFYAIGNRAGFVTWRVVINRVRGRLIFHGVMQQGNVDQMNRLLWAFYSFFMAVRTQADIKTYGETAVLTFVDALYTLP